MFQTFFVKFGTFFKNWSINCNFGKKNQENICCIKNYCLFL